jgi:hypothetical protein
MRLYPPHMRFAAVALVACCAISNAFATASPGDPADTDLSPTDGWQLLSSSPVTVVQAVPAGAQVPAPQSAAQRDASSTAASPLTIAATAALAGATPSMPTSGAAIAGAPFSLVAGEPLESQLMNWARRAGWKVLWNLPDDNNWIVPGDEACGTDFETAVSHVIEELASNGADVVGDSWRSNHTIVITQSGATE